MDLLQLRYFCTVARYENITKAAQEHMVPQPAMSKIISRLERELNVKLFARTGNRLFLTDKGRLFYEYIDKALLGISDAVQAISEEDDATSTDIRLLLNSNRNIILPFISDFQRANPRACFFINHNNGTEPFGATGQFLHHNLCISAMPVSPEYNMSTPLLKERLLIAVHKSHPFAHREAVMLDDLRHERFILLSARFRMHTYFLNFIQSNGIDPNICMYCTDPSYVRHAVDQNLGISVMPEFSWESVIGANTVLVPIAGENIHQTTRILWDSSRYMPPMVRAFRDELIWHYKKCYGPAE